MLDSGARLAAAFLPVGVPVIVGLVLAVLRRRELPAVTGPAIVGLALQLVAVLASTFLLAEATLHLFGLSPETLLPLSSVLGFAVILLQVVSWTLLLVALFRGLPGRPEDRTPTGRHALIDDRGHQVVADEGTVLLPVGAAAAGAGAGAGLGVAAGTRTDTPVPPLPRPGPPGPRHGAVDEPAPDGRAGRPVGPPSFPIPGPPVPQGPTREEPPAAGSDTGDGRVDGDERDEHDEPADTETFTTAPAGGDRSGRPAVAADDGDDAEAADDDRYPGYLGRPGVPGGVGADTDAADEPADYPGYLEGVGAPDAAVPDSPRGRSAVAADATPDATPDATSHDAPHDAAHDAPAGGRTAAATGSAFGTAGVSWTSVHHPAPPSGPIPETTASGESGEGTGSTEPRADGPEAADHDIADPATDAVDETVFEDAVAGDPLDEDPLDEDPLAGDTADEDDTTAGDTVEGGRGASAEDIGTEDADDAEPADAESTDAESTDGGDRDGDATPAEPEVDAPTATTPARSDGVDVAPGGHPWFDPDGAASRSAATPGAPHS